MTSVFVYIVASMGNGGITPIKLALAGSATSAVHYHLVSAIMLQEEMLWTLLDFGS